jgi:putative ABC transport system permease protein
MSRPRPPRLLDLLLRACLPSDWRDDIARDVEELFARRAPLGRARAVLWYAAQILSFGWRFAGYRSRSRIGAEGLHPRRARTRMGEIWRETRLAARSLLRAPGFTVPAVAVLGLGLGASGTLFTVVDGVLLEPLPLPDSHELVALCEEHVQMEGICIGSIATTRDLVRESRSLSAGGVARGWRFSLEDWIGREGLSSGIADPGFFQAVGLNPLLGRLFTDDEIGPDGDDVVLLSHDLWVRRYGSDPSVVGRTVRLDGDPAVIIGVLPEDFVVPTLEWIEAWRPLHVDPSPAEAREWRGFLALVRLDPEVGVTAARTELETLYRGLGLQFDAIDDGWRLGMRPLLDQVVGEARPAIVSLFGAVLLLLLIGCFNVANLVLARAARRRKELSIRSALGAGRGGILSVLALESVLLAVAAAALATALTFGGVRLFRALAPAGLPRLDGVGVNGSVLVFIGVVALVTVLVFGLWPALGTRHRHPGGGMTRLRSTGESRRGVAVRRGLVVAELALSTVLLFGGGLLVRTLNGYASWDPGFDRDGLYVVSALASLGEHPDREELMRFWAGVEEELRALPGIVGVSTASSVPLRGGREATTYRPEGGEDMEEASLPSARWFDVGPGHFAILGVPVLDGRELSELDDPSTPSVVVVNETFARRTWPGGRAVGRWLEVPLDAGGVRRMEVVGVVGDVRPLTPGQPSEPEMYWSNRQLGRWGTLFLVRASAGTADLGARVRETIEGIDPTVSLGTMRSMDQLLEEPLAGPRFNAVLAGVFSVLAAILAVIGLYAVLSYGVAKEGRTIGLRMAMGASPPRVLRAVLLEAGTLAVVGIVIGAAGALASAQLLGSLVHGVSPTDPLTLTGTVVLLISVSLAAAALPARRATRIDPSSLLREE